MGCSTCSGGGVVYNGSGFASNPNIPKRVITPAVDCLLTKEILARWKNTLKCIKNNNQLETIGLVNSSANQILGIIQSALNYPDNYCFYEQELSYFQTTVLPLIIEYASECYNQ